MKDHLQPQTGEPSSSPVDQVRIRKVIKAMGYSGVSLNSQQLELVGQKITEIDDIIPPSTHKLYGETIDINLVFRINQCVRSLPKTTGLKDLHLWKDNPFKIPAWTSIMLDLDTRQRTEITTIFGFMRRNSYAEMDLKDLSQLDLNDIKGLGVARTTVAQLVFQSLNLSIEDFKGETDEEIEEKLRRMIKIPGNRKAGLKTVRQKPLITFANTEFLRSPLPQIETVLEAKFIPVPTETSTKETRYIELRLWQYAVENDLMGRITGPKGLTSEEMILLENYFSKNGGRKPGKSLLDKFSILVANFA